MIQDRLLQGLVQQIAATLSGFLPSFAASASCTLSSQHYHIQPPRHLVIPARAAPDVLDQIQGGRKATLHSLEALLPLGRVATKRKDVVDATLFELHIPCSQQSTRPRRSAAADNLASGISSIMIRVVARLRETAAPSHKGLRGTTSWANAHSTDVHHACDKPLWMMQHGSRSRPTV